MDAADLRDAGFLKYIRTARRYFCDRYKIGPADFELLLYLDAMKRFTRKEWKLGAYTYSWDKHRWLRFMKDDWIEVFRNGNRKGGKANIYQLTHKSKLMIGRFYRVLAGEEDLPMTDRNPYYFETSYKKKTMTKAIDEMNKDLDR